MPISRALQRHPASGLSGLGSTSWLSHFYPSWTRTSYTSALFLVRREAQRPIYSRRHTTTPREYSNIVSRQSIRWYEHEMDSYPLEPTSIAIWLKGFVVHSENLQSHPIVARHFPRGARLLGSSYTGDSLVGILQPPMR